MNTVYRIYTEAGVLKEVYRIEDYTRQYFNGFTVFTGTGYWKSMKEDCLVIEIIGDTEDRDSVLKIASWIKTTFKQESVAITESPVTVYTIGRSL